MSDNELSDGVYNGYYFTDEELLDFDTSQTSQPLATSKPLVEFTENHPDWLEFLINFESRDIYKKRIDDFFNWQRLQIDDKDLLGRLKDYFHFFHDKKKEDGSSHYAPTIFRSWFSIFTKFWLMTGRGDLKLQAPVLYALFTTWETFLNSKIFIFFY